MQRKHLVRVILILAIAALPLLAMLLTSSPASAQRALPPANVVDEQLDLGERPAALPAPEASEPAATLIVDGACLDVSPADGTCDDSPLRYKTIQAGINAATGGDIISVLAGTYVENIVVDRSVELSGAGAGSTTILPAVSLPNPCTGSSMCGSITASSNIVVIQANNVKIHDFTLDGDNPSLTSGIVVNGADLDARNGIIEDFYSGVFNGLEVYDTTIENIYLRGIYASSGGSGFNIYNNIVDNVMADTSSIALFSFGGSGQFAGNTISRANDAIAANHSKGTQFLNNIVTTSGSGVHTDNAGDGGGGADLIRGNSVSACAPNGYGVWVFVPYIAPTVDNNTITDCEVGLSAWGDGATLVPPNTPVTTQFTNNMVDGPASAANSVGVYVTTDWISWGYSDISVSFSGNVVTDYETGLYFTADEQSWNPEPYEEKTITATFLDNSIAGNTNGIGMGVDGTYSVDASGNWWGTNVPATVAATVGAGIDYTPWLNSGTDTSSDPGFQGDFATLWVDDDSPQTGVTGRIQEGIDLVSGSTVNVAAGTYVEDLLIDKAVTLLGPNAAINPNTGSRVAEAVIISALTDPDPSGGCQLMVYVEVSDVTIKGFTIDGDNPALTSGTIINGADVDACELVSGYEGVGNIVVENNILKHSTYSGVEFYNYTNPAATAGNYIRYNRFEDIGETTYNWGIGVLVYNNFYADVTDNVMTGVRTGVQTGNYYNANPGTTGSISNNQIGVWRLGIFHNLAYGSASPFTISGNTITAEAYPDATKWNGLLLSSIGGAVNATITGNNIVIPGAVSFAPPNYTAGYNVWNVTTTAPIAIAGGTVTGGDYGIFVNNFEGYTSNADPTAVKIDGVTILGSDIAGVYVKDSPSNTNNATVYANIQNSALNTDAIGILVEGADATAKANLNQIAGNPTYGVNNASGNPMDAENNFWGACDGPGPVGPGSGDNVSANVDYDPFVTSAPAGILQALIDAAAPGDTIDLGTCAPYQGATVDKPLTINLNGSTIGEGSPGLTISADDVTVNGPGTLDGWNGSVNSTFPGVLVNAGSDNFILNGVEVKRWVDGVEVAGSVTSFKLVNNWIHSNTDAGLQVDSSVTLGGVVTIQGNLFKVNGGNGVQNDGDTANLNVEYNSWGADQGPTVAGGDGVGGSVDYDPWTFAEVYIDVDPTTVGDQVVRSVDESTTFAIDLNVDGENLQGLSFQFSYDTDYLTQIGSPVFYAPWAGGNCVEDGSSAGLARYICFPLTGPIADWDGGKVATFTFNANLLGILPNDPGSWSTYFDISADPADTNTGAAGGVKVFVNNAGYNDASVVPDRDITNTSAPYDGQINITGIAKFTGFVDVQGRPNDSGAVVEVFDTSTTGGSPVASGTSVSSGSYTTNYIPSNLLTVGTTYYFQVDRPLYLPTTVKYPSLVSTWGQSKLMATRPLTSLATFVLLGGDATNDDIVDIFDGGCIGPAYGGIPVVCNVTGSSDVNGDGTTNILDLVLFGGNYGLSVSSPWTP